MYSVLLQLHRRRKTEQPDFLLFVNEDTQQVLSVCLSIYLSDEDESEFERRKQKHTHGND